MKRGILLSIKKPNTEKTVIISVLFMLLVFIGIKIFTPELQPHVLIDIFAFAEVIAVGFLAFVLGWSSGSKHKDEK